MRLPRADLCCGSQRRSDEAEEGLGLWDDLCSGVGGVAYPFHLTESRAQCPSPAARHTLFPLPLYCFEPRRWSWLHKSGGNATRPVNHASCQAPPPNQTFMLIVHTHMHTQTHYLGLAMMSPCLSLFAGRMIRTTPSSRLKALASPCQPAERSRWGGPLCSPLSGLC